MTGWPDGFRCPCRDCQQYVIGHGLRHKPKVESDGERGALAGISYLPQCRRTVDDHTRLSSTINEAKARAQTADNNVRQMLRG
jgi:hypothetical protein